MYRITDEETNRILLDSPLSLPSSPSEVGMKASQTKAFFYKFINTLIKILNQHYDDIESNTSKELKNAINSLEKGLMTAIEETVTEHNDDDNAHLFLNLLISELKDEINKTGAKIDCAIDSHDKNTQSHSQLNARLEKFVEVHDQSSVAHSDIRDGIKSIEEKVNSTYNLASGKSKVMPLESSEKFFEYLEAGNVPNIGDMFIFESKNEPDITYYGKVDSSDGLIVLDYDAYKNGFIDLKPGNVYYHEGHKFIASESGIDTTVFAKTQELSELSYMLGNGLNDLSTRVSDLEASSLNHEKKKTYTTSTTTGTITLKTYGVTDLGEVSSLTLKLPSSILKDYNSVLNFKSGASATVLDAPADIYFKGDDCEGGCLYPISNRIYEISIRRVSGILIARVSSLDYEVVS